MPARPLTELLIEARSGNPAAVDEAFRVVYPLLHRIAGSYMRRERSDHTLQATALVNEAYLKLSADGSLPLADRKQFLGVAARVMRQVLVDHARARNADKRGSGAIKATLSEAINLATPGGSDVDVVILHDALTELESLNARQAAVVELRYFAGLSLEETGEVLGISIATVKREWTLARLWLLNAMQNV